MLPGEVKGIGRGQQRTDLQYSIRVDMVKNPPANAEDAISWVGKIPWSRQPTPVFLLGEFHGQRSLVGYSP